MLAKLNALEDDALENVISQILQKRPEIAPALIDKVCPDLTYAPTKALTHRRCNGTIKTANKQTGVGSIHCEEIEAIFGVDVQFHMNRIGTCKQGDSVSFALTLDKESEPWGFDIHSESSGPSSSSGMDMGAQMAAMAGMSKGMSGGNDMNPMDMMAMMNKMSGGGGMGMNNPMDMMAAMSKGSPGGMDMNNPMNMMAMMQKGSAGGMGSNPMEMMAAMQKGMSGGMDMNSMNMMCAMMAFGGGQGGGMGGASNPMMAAMGGMGGMPGAANPMMAAMGGGVGSAPNPMAPAVNPMMAAMGGGQMQTGPPDCHFYARSGWCKYGDQCILRHVGPAKAPPDQQKLGEHMGVIKSYNSDKGFGFIACDALKEEHKGDVFLSQKHVGDFQAGSAVKFTAYLVDGKLQGRNLEDATGQVGPQQGAGGKPGGSAEEDIGDFIGTIKSYNSDKGFGFIVSPVLRAQGYDTDVFLPPDTIGSFAVGSSVAFTAFKKDGRIRCRDLTDASGMPGGPVGNVVLPPGGMLPPPGGMLPPMLPPPAGMLPPPPGGMPGGGNVVLPLESMPGGGNIVEPPAKVPKVVLPPGFPIGL